MKFTVEGMTCDHCVAAVTRMLHAHDPGARIAVDLAAGTVDVSGALSADRAAAAIASAGFTVVAVDAPRA